MAEGGPAGRRRLREWSIRLVVAASIAAVAFVIGYVRPWSGVPVEPQTPDLVAVQIHADWCNRTPVIGPIFEELAASYGNRPVLFVTLDITDDTRAKQARLLAENLGIGHIYDPPFESGMIKLVDRRAGTVLATATGEDQTPEVAHLLAGLPEFSDNPSAGSGG